MANRRLRLQKFELENVNYLYLGAFRLRVEASDPEDTGADPAVFLYLRRPANPYNGDIGDIFQTIASPVDMAEYPVGEPNVDTPFPIFRLPYVELDLRSVDLAEDSWGIIVSEVDTLLKSLNRMEDLVPTVSVDVGGDATGGGGGGSSSSSESS